MGGALWRTTAPLLDRAKRRSVPNTPRQSESRCLPSRPGSRAIRHQRVSPRRRTGRRRHARPERPAFVRARARDLAPQARPGPRIHLPRGLTAKSGRALVLARRGCGVGSVRRTPSRPGPRPDLSPHLETGAGGDRRRRPAVDGADDLAAVYALQVDGAPRGAMRKEMTDDKHLIRAGWNAGPGLMQRPGEAGGPPRRGIAREGEASPTM